MGFNSTIIRKKKPCKRCGVPSYIFSKGRCKQCSTIEDTAARMEEYAEQEAKEDGLTELIKQADEVFSKWLRKSQANKSGMVLCYTCDSVMRYQAAQAGHYIKRGNLFLRWDPRNLRVQGECCNIFKDGNYPEFTKRLEAERPGITQILYEESLVVYKPTRDEVRAIINEYTHKLKQLK